MKKVIFLMLVLATGYMSAGAQGDDKPAPRNDEARMKLTPEQRAKQAADRLSSNVQLTAEQYAKVMEINKNFFIQRDALKPVAKEGNEEAKNKLKAIAKEREDKTMALLTPEQQKKEREARVAHRPEGHPEGRE